MLDKNINLFVKIFLGVFLFLFTWQCSSSRNSISKKTLPIPSWVSNTPVSSMYYIGIGTVNKSVDNYREVARKSAIENLSNEISVQVSSESILQTIETNSSFEQEYKQLIQLNSDKYLEGYQLVEDYEDDSHYYVYYQLSKKTYQELQARLLKEATNNCLSFIAEGDKNIVDADYRLAVINYTKAMEALINYLDKNITAEYNGKSEILPFLIIRKMQQLHQAIQIIDVSVKTDIILGQFISPENIGVSLKDSSRIISNYPVVLEYKSQFRQINTLNSNTQGNIYWDITKIKSEIPNQTVRFSLATVQIIEQTTRNRIVRELLKNLTVNELIIPLKIQLPKVYVKNHSKLSSILYSEIKSALIQNKLEVNSNEQLANIIMVVEIEEDEARKSDTGLGIIVELKAVVTFTSSTNGKVLYTEAIHNIKGTQSSAILAKNIAYQNLSKQISSRVIPLFANSYF
jgi:hypothetical protein